MGAIATCTVIRPNNQKLTEPVEAYGLKEEEKSYSGTILFFENSKAYVVRDDNKIIYWVNVKHLTEVTPL